MKNGVIGMGAAVLLLALGMGGCANQQRLDMAMDENRSLKNSLNELQGVNAQLKNENELLQKQRMSNEALIAQYKKMNDEMGAKLGLSEEELKKLEGRLSQLTFGEIDPVTDRALQDLANQHPDLITYDSKQGLLRFSSDLTFDSGQDQVKSEAAQSLAALARILKTGPAAGYEVRIVGHTDAQPISAVTATRHPTNMHLSCHRAIAVRQALAGQGVSTDKMYAAGWGEERPIAPSGPKGASQANRRVEIYLTKSTAMAGAAKAPTKIATPEREPDMTK